MVEDFWARCKHISWKAGDYYCERRGTNGLSDEKVCPCIMFEAPGFGSDHQDMDMSTRKSSVKRERS
jgi:hypothetical protein